MKKILLTTISIMMLIFVGVSTTNVSGYEADTSDITENLKYIDFGTVNIGVNKNYGEVKQTYSDYVNKPYKYHLLTKTITITNTAKTEMNATVYIPYLYTYGLNPTDNTSYGHIGYPAVWDSENNKFIYSDYATNGSFVYDYDSSKVSVSYPERGSLKDAEYFINDKFYNSADQADWTGSVPTVRELASARAEDTVMAFNAGVLQPGETQTISFTIKSYGLPGTVYSGVTGIDFETYLAYEVAGEQVQVRYVDEAGNEIADEIILNETDDYLADAEYTTTAKEIDGYTLSETPANANGLYSDEVQNVTYVYQRQQAAGNVYVIYQDVEGNAIAPDDVLSGAVGAAYISEAKVINGYSLSRTPDNASGQFSSDEQTVVYTYMMDEITGGNSNTTTNSISSSTSTTESSSNAVVNELPKTGTREGLLMIGLGIVSIVSGGLLWKKIIK